MDSTQTQENGHQLAEDIKEERVDTEDQERNGPPFLAPDIDDEHEQAKQKGRQTASHQHKGRTPHRLVEGQPILQQIATDDEHGAREQERHHLVGSLMFFLYQPSAEEAQQGMGDGRQRAKQTFGVDG